MTIQHVEEIQNIMTDSQDMLQETQKKIVTRLDNISACLQRLEHDYQSITAIFLVGNSY